MQWHAPTLRPETPSASTLIYDSPFPRKHTDPLSLLPDLLLQVAKREPVQVIEQDFWVSVDKPDDIPAAEELLKKHAK